MDHDFDWIMQYCRACGVAAQSVMDSGQTRCPGGGNVVAISHLVRGRRLSGALGLEWDHYGQRPRT